MDDVSPELKAFLNMVIGQPADTPFTRRVKARMDEVKQNAEMRREFMMLWMRDQEKIEQGRKEGRREGRKEGRKEGRREGLIEKARAMTLRLAAQGVLPSVIAAAAEVDIGTVQRWLDEA